MEASVTPLQLYVIGGAPSQTSGMQVSSVAPSLDGRLLGSAAILLGPAQVCPCVIMSISSACSR